MKGKTQKLFAAYGFLVYMFLYIPIIVLVIFSFNESKLNAVWTGFSFKWYVTLFHNDSILEALKNSLTIAFFSTIFSVILGTVTAIGLYKYKFKGKSLIDNALLIPIIIPEIVLGIAMLAFFSKAKMDNSLLNLIIAHVTFSVSYVIIVIRESLENFDRTLEDAALDLGEKPLKAFFKVTLPIIMPGVISGGLLAFTLSLDDVIISFFVAGPGTNTLPLKVFSMVKFGVTPEINALSTILLIGTIIIVSLMQLMSSNKFKRKKTLTRILAGLMVITFVGINFIKTPAKEAAPKEVLNIFNWSEYLPQSIIDNFEKTYNIKVNYSTFSSNEEMLAKLMAGGNQFDLVVASDYMVDVLKKQKLIQPISKDSITNFKNLDPKVINLDFDKNNEYSIPYMWGDVSIVYDSEAIKTPIEDYKDLWKPELKNTMVVLDDQRIVIGMALKKLGYPLNETSPVALEKAKAELLKLKPNIKAFDSDSPKTLLINGEAKIGLVWGAEAALAKRENPKLKVAIPKEGLILQQDNFVVPTNSKNKTAAEKFMNFILEPEVSAEISRSFPYANPNSAAIPYIDSNILKDIAIYPPDEAVKEGEHLKDVGEAAAALDDVWTHVK